MLASCVSGTPPDIAIALRSIGCLAYSLRSVRRCIDNDVACYFRSLSAVRRLFGWRPGDLGVLREVFRGFSEEARTRGIPSPSFGGFGFMVVTTNYSRKLPDCPIVNRIETYTGS